MINFKNCPYDNAPFIGDSEWIRDIYNDLFGEKEKGFLVEIGVGCTLNWRAMNTFPRILNPGENFIRGKSTTLELIEHGWDGIYIEPIEEFLTNELAPLLKTIVKKENNQNIKLAPVAASNENKTMCIIGNETLGPLDDMTSLSESNIPYSYKHRKIKCEKTSDILQNCGCPKHIDVMSIDVEGQELSVLRGIDFSKHLPKLIFIEIDKTSIESIMEILPDGYEIIAKDYLNAAIVLK